MRTSILTNLIFAGPLAAGAVQADTVGDLLAEYKDQGAGTFNSSAGEALWQRKFPSADGAQRACTSCHTGDLKRSGRHAVTGKAIEPLAPSANAKRFSFSRCETCHRGADQGDFDEHRVRVPGYGRWDD